MCVREGLVTKSDTRSSSTEVRIRVPSQPKRGEKEHLPGNQDKLLAANDTTSPPTSTSHCQSLPSAWRLEPEDAAEVARVAVPFDVVAAAVVWLCARLFVCLSVFLFLCMLVYSFVCLIAGLMD